MFCFRRKGIVLSPVSVYAKGKFIGLMGKKEGFFHWDDKRSQYLSLTTC